MSAALRATAEVERFEEAWAWFGRRVPMTRADRDKLIDWAGARAWWVTGAANLDVVMACYTEVQNAIDLGTPPHELAKRLEKLLPNLTQQRLATIARTNLQHAFNAGRWAQMTDPDVLELRPYWKFDAILDARTTDGCRALDGVALPANDPTWLTNWPPRHHQCRSQVRAIRPKEYARLPEAKRRLPDQYEPTAKGFGLPPSVELPWQPDLSKVPAELRQVTLDKADAHQQEQAKQAAAKREKAEQHRPEHWLSEYEPTYGSEAGPALARGRAALEAGLDERACDVLTELRRLMDAGACGLASSDQVAKALELRGTGDVRGAVEGLTDDQAAGLRAAAAIAGHSLAIDRGPARRIAKMRVKDAAKRGERAGSRKLEAERFFSAFLGRDIAFPTDWLYRYGFVQRSYCKSDKREIAVADRSLSSPLLHEIGHALEALNPTLYRRARAFLEARTRGEQLTRLRDLFPGHGYRGDEAARPDRFFSAYMGKAYPAATEITSMLVEALWTNPAELYRQDPEAFLFVLGQMLQAA